MLNIRNMLIVKKLGLLLLVTISASVIISCVIFLSFTFFSRIEGITSYLTALADITGNNCQVALSFNIKEDAEKNLRSLSVKPSIIFACIYDSHGNEFATYGKMRMTSQKLKQMMASEGHHLKNGSLWIVRRIVFNKDILGHIIIVDDLEALKITITLSIYIMIAVLLLALAFVAFFGNHFQRIILLPVIDLTAKAKIIEREGNYSIRANVAGNDEFGLLGKAFNQMLSKIENQNKELKLAKANLELRVVERTNQLEEANKELDAFSYSVSHDLKAPLRAISGFSHIIVEDYAEKLNADGKHAINVISEGVMKMGQLIDDLLSFAHLNREKMVSSRIVTKELVQSISGEMREATPPGRNVQVQIKALPDAYGDPAMIRQVWVNLLSNAIKFTKPKKIAEIEIGSIDAEKEEVYYVKDNGVGFDMKYSDKLFGVFQRLHGESEFEGTGVGLAIVQRVIHRHGGRVWAEGKVNEGATFYFSLPKGG